MMKNEYNLWLDPCWRIVSITGFCKSSTLNLSNTSIARCSVIHLSWAYAIYIDNDGMMGPVEHIYRLINDQEIEITTTDSKLIQYSDSNYQVILKLQNPSKFIYYDVFIDYQVKLENIDSWIKTSSKKIREHRFSTPNKTKFDTNLFFAISRTIIAMKTSSHWEVKIRKRIMTFL